MSISPTQMSFIPLQHALEGILLVFHLTKNMRFAWVANHFHISSQKAKGDVELLSLRNRYTDIRFSMHDQSGGTAMADKPHGGMFVIEFGIRCQIIVVALQVAGGNIRGGSHREEVRYGGSNDGGLKPVTVRDSPRGHESTETPATDAEPIRIGNTPSNQKIDTVQDVLEVSHTPVSIVCFRERDPCSIRTTRVREKYRIPVRCQNRPPVIPGAMKPCRPCLLGPTMNVH